MTSTIPKELLPIGTRPMLQWCLTEALEGGFEEIGVVVREDKPLLVEYLEEERWREGLLDHLRPAADRARIVPFRQARPAGVVDAVLAARAWIEERRPFAVFLPDNVRVAGSPPVIAADLEEAASRGAGLVACHRIGPETRRWFGDVGRAELEDLVPAGERARVTSLQERGEGAFRAPPEGAWRLMPRYVVVGVWIDAAREVAAEAASVGIEADDVAVHRRLVASRRLFAAPWSGSMVDAGRPAGYLYAQRLLHAAEERRLDDQGDDAEPGGLLSIER